MKCQHCDKQATFHITELTDMEPQEFHLCADHAQDYLSPTEEVAEPNEITLAGMLAKQLKIGQTAEELARLDQQACPVCGITFYEFRHAGRLGCPNDYVCFEDDLEPLIVNIHGEARHIGKSPKRGAIGSQRQTELIRMRREMKQVVDQEEYERASELRDEIRKLEQELDPEQQSPEQRGDES